MQALQEALVKTAAQAGPPASVSVSGLVLFGVPLPDWILVITGILAAVNLFVVVRDKLWHHYRKKKEVPRVEQEGRE